MPRTLYDGFERTRFDTGTSLMAVGRAVTSGAARVTWSRIWCLITAQISMELLSEWRESFMNDCTEGIIMTEYLLWCITGPPLRINAAGWRWQLATAVSGWSVDTQRFMIGVWKYELIADTDNGSTISGTRKYERTDDTADTANRHQSYNM